MTSYIRDLGPSFGEATWREAQGLLEASDTIIGHIDTGVFPHATLGYAGETPPANILLDRGANFFDPDGPNGAAPVTDLTVPDGALADFPDHGVKTLSIILANREGELRGAAPGAKIIPYRVCNGPVFLGEARTGLIGRAMDHAMNDPVNAANPPKVFTISMGNPGVTGPTEVARLFVGGRPGMEKETTDAINEAYDRGIIIVCAAGQVINQIIYPARFGRTIAVGGIRQDETHYPSGGYQNSGEPDVWAYAANINRAAGHLANGQIVQTHADDPNSEDGEPSGTSYAAPQVAAAAAMWVTRWSVELRALGEGWKTVEAFRKALWLSSNVENIKASPNSRRKINIRRLDIDRLLRIPPDPHWALHERNRVSAAGSLL
ncbi:MAG: S8/S53 family peptidase [Pseudomonadota bacterium]